MDEFSTGARREIRLSGPVLIIQSDDDPGDMGEPRQWHEDDQEDREIVVVPPWEAWGQREIALALEERIRTLEADASQMRDVLERTVYMLDWTGDMAMHLPFGYDETRLAALALLYPDSPDRARALQERMRATG